MADNRTRLAAIDIGTNSIHLVVADVDPRSGKFNVLDREKEIARLGSGSSDMKYLSESAMNRGIETIKRFKTIADAAGAPIRALATSAVREALNQKEFIRRVQKETGIRIEIASGVEEARLIYLGALQALPIFHKNILLVDIGGGSSEFLVGKERRILYANSLKIGALRLTQRFFSSDDIDSKAVNECRRYVAGMINPVVREVKKHDCEVFVGTSGTILNIANMIRAMRDDEDTQANNFTFSQKELRKVAGEVIEAKDSRQRSGIRGLDPARVDIIVAGVIILDEILRALKIKRMVISEYALREGIILDTFEKKRNRRNLHHLHDIRYQSVLHLAQNLHYERKHSHHVSKLALALFDQTKRLHELGDTEREFLEAASILHEIGLFVSHAQHHRHSYYLIKNAELMGFTENEKEIIANIARYHRKSHPKFKHENFDSLNANDQEIVRRLASLLRIADGLDRSHSLLVKGVKCRTRGKRLVCELKPAQHAKLDLELWGADRKKELFEEVFDRKLRFEVK
jgi:exopolyphosphatase/guanosine-5'-triphosphate,3'-diphosphate pyrophosphatase